MNASDISPDDIDLMAKTAMLEDRTPEGRAGVAHVMLNRLNSGKYPSTMSGIIMQRNAFEPVGSPDWNRANPNSPDFKNARDIVQSVVKGDIPDPTSGATLFYSPTAQAYKGRPAPDWSAGRAPTYNSSAGNYFYTEPGTKPAPSPASNSPSYDFTKEFQTSSEAPAAQPASYDFTKEFPVSAPQPSAAPTQAPVIPSKQAPAASPPALQGTPSAANFATEFPIAPSQNTQGPQSGSGVSNSGPPTPQGVDAEFLNSMPIIGPQLVKAGAAVNAGLAPIAPYLGSSYNALAGTSEIPQGANFSERYQNALSSAERDRLAFESGHPLASTGVRIGGSVAGTLPVMAAAPAAFGMGAAPWLLRTPIGAVSGGALAAADTAGRDYFAGNSFNPGGVLRNAEWGAALGGLAVPAGALLETGVNSLFNLAARTSPAARNVASTLAESGISPTQARSALSSMGPYGTLADIDPALQLKASVLAESGGEPTSILKNAMLSRAAGANDRVGQAVDQYLGQRPDVTATEESIKQAASTAASPYYNAARASAQPMDVSPVLSYIDSTLPKSAGAVKDTLNTAKSYLTNPGPTGIPVPKDDPQALLGARQALDDLIERRGTSDTTAGKNAIRQATTVRSQLDSILKTDPNIAAGDREFSTQMSNLDALHEGQDVFKNATRIEDVSRSIAGKTPAQVSSMQQGALSAVHDALDNARQGDFSAARSLFSKSTANRAKLDALFPNAGKVFDTVANEIAMRGTENAVAGGSKTAGLLAAKEEFGLPQRGPISTGAAIAGNAVGGPPGAIIGVAGKAYIDHLMNVLDAGARGRLMTGMARGLGAQAGPEQTDFMNAVARASTTSNASNAIGTAARAGPYLGASGAVNPLIDQLWKRQ